MKDKEKYAKDLLEIACNGKSVAVCREKMKNKEKYANELLEIACDGKSVAVCVETEKPVACEEMSCGRCLFFVNEICEKEKNVRTWAESEYIEKPVITKRDRAFLDYIGSTYKFICKDIDGKLFVCKDTYTSGHRWFSRECVIGSDYTYISGFEVQFPMIKGVYPIVWLIEDLKTLEVVDSYE